MNFNYSDPKDSSGSDNEDSQPSTPPQPYFPEDVNTTDRGQLTINPIDISDKYEGFDIR